MSMRRSSFPTRRAPKQISMFAGPPIVQKRGLKRPFLIRDASNPKVKTISWAKTYQQARSAFDQYARALAQATRNPNISALESIAERYRDIQRLSASEYENLQKFYARSHVLGGY